MEIDNKIMLQCCVNKYNELWHDYKKWFDRALIGASVDGYMITDTFAIDKLHEVEPQLRKAKIELDFYRQKVEEEKCL